MNLVYAELFWIAVGAYVAVGFLFALIMVLGMIARLDPMAAKAPLRVKILLIPGLVALWPVLGWRTLKVRSGGPP